MPVKSMQGLVVAAHGRHYMVELADGSMRRCYPRGKRLQAAVGDHVVIEPAGKEEGRITAILERRNLLYRSDDVRSKQFAANIDQLLFVVAVDPSFSLDLIGRALVAAWHADIVPIIILNKIDLTHSVAHARSRLEWLKELDVPVIELSALDTVDTRARLLPVLQGKRSLLLGQSAMGKSTVLNALVPEARALTQAHSQALSAGRHTTTVTRLYRLPDSQGAELIDSPGFQSFGLHHLDAHDIEHGFPEFKLEETSCRFYDCSHRQEPGCGVRQRLSEGLIHPARYRLYERLLEEHEEASRY